MARRLKTEIREMIKKSKLHSHTYMDRFEYYTNELIRDNIMRVNSINFYYTSESAVCLIRDNTLHINKRADDIEKIILTIGGINELSGRGKGEFAEMSYKANSEQDFDAGTREDIAFLIKELDDISTERAKEAKEALYNPFYAKLTEDFKLRGSVKEIDEHKEPIRNLHKEIENGEKEFTEARKHLLEVEIKMAQEFLASTQLKYKELLREAIPLGETNDFTKEESDIIKTILKEVMKRKGLHADDNTKFFLEAAVLQENDVNADGIFKEFFIKHK